ncbi:alpha/beta-hydrolase, partial [Rhizopogon vinicolor AM-OR11-026]
TGGLRWEAPQPPLTTSSVQQATTQPGGCYTALPGAAPNNPQIMGPTDNESEDCLFLNVHVPGGQVVPSPSGGLPVVVWVHGGGYISGAASGYDGGDLIKHSNYGVIVVVIQYRLGLFGFLAGKAVKEGGALNAGLLDQNYALQWVQAHISNFGGDPAKVTLWGESAGGGSVLQQLVAHGGNTQPPLFRAAITSSPFLPSQYNYNDEKPEMLYSKVVNGAHCNSVSDTLSCLRTADAKTLQLLNFGINIGGFFGTFTFVPVVDGTFIVERPTVTIGKGRLNGERLLAVTNAHEGDLFVNQRMLLPLTEYIKRLFPHFGSAQAAGTAMMYQGLGSNIEQANLAMGEAMFVCPAYYLLEAYGEKSWKGKFSLPPALHIDDVAYYFTSQGPRYNNAKFITSFATSFMSFIMNGTPGVKYNSNDIKPTWNSWQYGFNEIVFDNKPPFFLPNVYASQTDVGLFERCAFWRSVSGYTLQ